MADWRPEQHPRDWRGRFITTGARVRLQGGLMGRVTGIQPARRADLPASITVESDDGRVGTVPSDQLTIAEPPSGTVFLGDGHIGAIGETVGRIDAPGESVIQRIDADGGVWVSTNGRPAENVSPESLTRSRNAPPTDPQLQRDADANTPEPGAQAPAAEITPEGVRNRYDLRAIRARATPQEQRALDRAERAQTSAARAAENARYSRSSGGSRVQSRAEVRANQRIRDAEVEVQRVEDGIYDRLVQEETARRAAPAAPAAPAVPAAPAAPSGDRFAPSTPQWVRDVAGLDPAKQRDSIQFQQNGDSYRVGERYANTELVGITVDRDVYGGGVVVYRNTITGRYETVNLKSYVGSVRRNQTPEGNRLRATAVAPRTAITRAMTDAGVQPATSSTSAVRGFRRTSAGYRATTNDDGTWNVEYDSGMGVGARTAETSGRANERRTAMADALERAGLTVSAPRDENNQVTGNITVTGRGDRQTTPTPAAPTPAAPTPVAPTPVAPAPTPDAPTNPDNPTPGGPTAADGLPLAVDDRITVNGRSGRIVSVREGSGIAVYEDEDGKRRSSRIGNFTHANDTPAETAPANAPETSATPTPETPAVPDAPTADQDAARHEIVVSEIERLDREIAAATSDNPAPGSWGARYIARAQAQRDELDAERQQIEQRADSTQTVPAAPAAPDVPTGPAPTVARRAVYPDGTEVRVGDQVVSQRSNQPMGEVTRINPDDGSIIVATPDGGSILYRNVTSLIPVNTAQRDVPVPQAPVAPTVSSGPVAGDGLPLVRDDVIEVNGVRGTVISTRDKYGIVIYRDETGKQRSTKYRNATHAASNTATVPTQ